MKTWLIAYDIADDRVRYRVARRLLREGMRVQESVFEVVAKRESDFTRLEADLRKLCAGAKEAQVRWYGLNQDGYARSGAIGGAAPALPPAVEVW